MLVCFCCHVYLFIYDSSALGRVLFCLFCICIYLFISDEHILSALGQCCFVFCVVFGLFCICRIYLLVPDKDVLSALWPIVQQLRLCQSQSSPGPPPTVVSEPDLLKNSLNIISGVLIIVAIYQSSLLT